jgi:hypothetical protein
VISSEIRVDRFRIARPGSDLARFSFYSTHARDLSGSGRRECVPTENKIIPKQHFSLSMVNLFWLSLTIRMQGYTDGDSRLDHAALIDESLDNVCAAMQLDTLGGHKGGGFGATELR